MSSVDPSTPSKIIDWADLSSIPYGDIPEFWAGWLADRGSLTQRLVDASNYQFSVNVLSQLEMIPNHAENKVLNVGASEPALIRQVVLSGQETPWVFARSIMPLSTLKGRLAALRNINNKPLGAILFNDPSMTRSIVQVTHTTADTLEVPNHICNSNTLLWGRRSVFFLDQKPLLVSEIFLPTFKPYNQDAV